MEKRGVVQHLADQFRKEAEVRKPDITDDLAKSAEKRLKNSRMKKTAAEAARYER
ncbi:MAG: hypothetical protein IJV91_05750 [Kiritimatiellae bacterium]|nr:hypothetical protein [Kiritimatiellia bacterium]